jgi:uncharacterized protein (TIGR02270 family)
LTTPYPYADPIPAIVQEHAEETASLREHRTHLVRAPQVDLPQLQRHDERLAAHIDGLAVAGAFGTACCAEALDPRSPGTVFAAAVNAIEVRDEPALERLCALARSTPAALRGLISAFGWVSAPRLQGLVQPLLASTDPHRRTLGLAACRLHHVDPGALLPAALQDSSTSLRTQALRTAGCLGRTDLLDRVRAALDDADVAVEAARSLCLLGDHQAALPVLQAHVLDEAPDVHGTRLAALSLLLQCAEFDHGQHVLRAAARSANGNLHQERLVIRAIGLLGDVQWVPWLIARMAEEARARLAGEAFSMITGADLSALGLERSRPDDPAESADADPADDDVALDEDEGLPWPDRERMQRWWETHATTLPAQGRCFAGAPPGVAHCEQVLKRSTQRQRMLAASWLCILQPGRQLFNCAAPAWCQQRLLAGTA